ncbi:uncharacterized protein MONOS_14796 [Monocercomonoides exilis]|uniref:uncharacterized protein n=1 Tax=Monocercomonoides exilis TaxID=2049356 RepID=UPI003559D271|nr:hypothetical protein MONOS_14796 [Monocercomonoides exilis]|eukprot:MONOS_14796.1-p1 / transcript=MONOS_14796.1 / gene=MONOS_14796 / organism=Monocercomonoides_exilis_PA203 / gene_product=unspecified product / transcript_product=unspecified product / location=Mono_scaffold01075:12505-12870(+) / protein_length=122 / sequence_SO=supercontig / SO=protein_coding / is_pseudo=false
MQDQLVAMKKKTQLIDVGIEKEKKLRTQQCWVVNGDSTGSLVSSMSLFASSSLPVFVCGRIVPSSAKLILTSKLHKKFQEKFSCSIGDRGTVMIGPDERKKELSVKEKSGASVEGVANSCG